MSVGEFGTTQTVCAVHLIHPIPEFTLIHIYTQTQKYTADDEDDANLL